MIAEIIAELMARGLHIGANGLENQKRWTVASISPGKKVLSMVSSKNSGRRHYIHKHHSHSVWLPPCTSLFACCRRQHAPQKVMQSSIVPIVCGTREQASNDHQQVLMMEPVATQVTSVSTAVQELLLATCGPAATAISLACCASFVFLHVFVPKPEMFSGRTPKELPVPRSMPEFLR